jgi:hypothetical protein
LKEKERKKESYRETDYKVHSNKTPASRNNCDLTIMGCINVMTGAMRLMNIISQNSEQKIITVNPPSLDFLSDEFAVCHEMMRDFEKDGFPQAFMIELVGKYLDEIVAHNDRSQV